MAGFANAGARNIASAPPGKAPAISAIALGAGLALAVAGPATARPHATAAKAPPPAPVASPAAMKLHASLLTLDTHLDTPASLVIPGWSIMDRHDVKADFTQVDVPRMKAGHLDGGFWAIYTPQGPLTPAATRAARDSAMMRGIAIREMVAAHPAAFGLADKAADAAKIAASGRIVVFESIENAWPLGDDVTLLDTFYKMGVRISGFAHFRNNQFADSATDKEQWGGLSPAGRALLAEMNRLGIVPDLSHSSDKALDDAFALSKAPIILTHSGCKAVFDHPRNIDDAHLRQLAALGGRATYLAERRAVEASHPAVDPATFDNFLANLLHALKVAGVDHVGIGADWDGGGGVVGLEDVVSLPKITEALLKAGYTREDVGKIWSGNVLRVLAAAEAEAAREAATPAS
eukprot:gene4480-4526_t